MTSFWMIWFFSLFIKFILAWYLPLSPDESYYWIWSKNLQLSYYDHPGMVAWLFRLGHSLEPYGHLVRWPFLVLSHLTLIVWYWIFKTLNLESHYRPWLLLALTSPFMGWGGLVVTPDIPLLFFWSLSLYFFITWTVAYKTKDLIFLGLCLGLGFCSKYNIVLFVPCALIYLFFFQKKIKLLSLSFGTSLLITLLMFLTTAWPVMIWNYKNNFQSFAFQTQRGFFADHFSWSWVLDYTLGTILILTPIVFYWAIKNRRLAPVFICFAFFPTIFFFISSFRGPTELNWPSVAYPSFFALAVISTYAYKSLRSVVLFWSFIISALFLSFLFPQTRYIDSKVHEPWTLETLSDLPAKYEPFYAGNYQLAASLTYFSKKMVYKFPKINRYDFFDTLIHPPIKHSVFYLLKEDHVPLPDWFNMKDWRQTEIGKYGRNLILLKFEAL